MKSLLSIGITRKTSFVLASILIATTSLVSGCAAWDWARAGARVSPVIGRDATKKGVGGYVLTEDIERKGVKYVRQSVEPQPVNLDSLVLPGEKGPAYDLAKDDARARNRLQDYMLRISDEVCLEHKSSILAVSSAFNGTLSGTTSLLGGLGAIFTQESTTRALSGAAGITNAFRDNINQNVYYNNFASAIVRQIDLQRTKQLQDIEPKRARDHLEYSVDESLRDVNQYHGLCSFSEAIAALASETKRPSTADELRGKLSTLRAELKENRTLIDAEKEGSVTRAQLERTNGTISRLMQEITLQLALVEGVSAATAASPDASKTGKAAAPADTSKTGKAADDGKK